MKSCLKYEILCSYHDSDYHDTRSGTIAYTQLLLHKNKNKIQCSAPLRICVKRVVEATQNQELWVRSHTKPGDNPC